MPVISWVALMGLIAFLVGLAITFVLTLGYMEYYKCRYGRKPSVKLQERVFILCAVVAGVPAALFVLARLLV